MNPDRRTSLIIGVLLISGIVFGILNSIPALEQANYLTILAGMKTHVLIAVFFQTAMAIAYTSIAILFYPIIKEYDERLAIGYFGFRIIGSAFLFVGIFSLLLLLTLSQSFVSSSQINSSYFKTIGELLRTGRDLMNHIGMILPWSIGGLLLYYSMLKTKRIPRWLALWGLIGSVCTLTVTFMVMLDFVEIVTPIYFVMNTPTALFELFLAVFLMVKGFNPIIVHSTQERD